MQLISSIRTKEKKKKDVNGISVKCSTLILAFSKYIPTTQRMFFCPMFRIPIVSIESIVKGDNVFPFQ